MAIYMAGIDHNKANIDVRSVFSFTKRQMEDAYANLRENAYIDGCVLICTCNRTEIWLSVSQETAISPVDILCDCLKVDAEKYKSYFTVRAHNEAVTHLFRLASGMKSKIIGEDQIITQVGDAIALARRCYAADRTLEVLFRLAVTAAKQVKTETVLSTADKSVIHTALRKLYEKGISVRGKKCMVIGNGIMGKLAAETLLEQGAEVTVTVRQHHNGQVEIPEGCGSISYAKRYEKLRECDFVVSASSGPNYTLGWDELMQLNINHHIYIIDLAVPRDVEPKTRELWWARLYDIDDFNIDLIPDSLKENLKKAEAILREKENEFYRWYDSRDAAPRIQKIKDLAGADTGARLIPVMRQIPLDEDDKQQLNKEIEGASARMMNRLLFEMRLKLTDKVFQECLDAMEEILGEDNE